MTGLLGVIEAVRAALGTIVEAETPVTARSPMARRIVRLTVVASIFALAAAAFGLWPDGWTEVKWSGAETRPAGSWPLAGCAVMQVITAITVSQRPTRLVGLVWIGVTILTDLMSLAIWGIQHFTFARWEFLWPGQMMLVCAGAATALVFLVLPVVMLASDRTAPSAAARARVVEG